VVSGAWVVSGLSGVVVVGLVPGPHADRITTNAAPTRAILLNIRTPEIFGSEIVAFEAC
jgi:hypothetical protein